MAQATKADPTEGREGHSFPKTDDPAENERRKQLLKEYNERLKMSQADRQDRAIRKIALSVGVDPELDDPPNPADDWK